jgi:hypothetical protein
MIMGKTAAAEGGVVNKGFSEAFSQGFLGRHWLGASQLSVINPLFIWHRIVTQQLTERSPPAA